MAGRDAMNLPAIVGREYVLIEPVTEEESAERYGNPGFAVLATPALVGFVERAAIELLGPALDDASGSVGGRIEMVHSAPTVIGATVEVRARIVRFDGWVVDVEFRVFEGASEVARGTHRRHIVDRGRFMQRLTKKDGR
jgi:fluoroacetyl-CoA thioesterase